VKKRRTAEERYNDNIRKQVKALEDFAAHETEWAEDLMLWYGARNEEMPADIYRAYAFFMNKEYLRKTGSLALLYEMSLRCYSELPQVTKENAFDILCFKFKMYAKALKAGGYNGEQDF
jgi:hypothetical protein